MQREVTQVFISYARADGLMVSELVERELQSGGFKVWRDVRSLDAFNDFSVEIERAIARSDVIVVCVTASIEESPDSFVRREILYAQGKNKPIVPIRISGATVPTLINHLTWINASDVTNLVGTLAPEVQRRLELREKIKISADERTVTVTFVRGLVDDIIDFLEATTKVLLDIAATGRSPVPGPQHGGLPDTMQPLFRPRRERRLMPGALGQTLVEKHERIILHGDPGSGKTTSLLIAAREAANAWLEDPGRRLPIFCRAADWRASEDESLLEWLDRSTPLLPTGHLGAAIESGHVTLFIDGLDELESKIQRFSPEGNDSPVSRDTVSPEHSKQPRIIDPRSDLVSKLPSNVSALVTCRSNALREIGKPDNFAALELESIKDEEIAEFLGKDVALAELLRAEPNLRDLVLTPLTLGLLSFVANAGELDVHDVLEVEKLSARLKVVNDFTVSRWRHEERRGGKLASICDLVGVLGRVATRHGDTFSESEAQDAAKVDAVDATLLLQTAVQVGFVRRSSGSEISFFHPTFAEYYATIHCWQHLGHQSPDGYDERLFHCIARLRDPAFIPPLVAMVGFAFWRGEYGDQIAWTLNAIGGPESPEVVNALLHLAGYSGLRFFGLTPIGDFARRCSDELKAQFVNQLSSKAKDDHEAVHQLLGLGEPGLEAVICAYEQLDENAPMRSQIESYSIVRERLGLPHVH